MGNWHLTILGSSSSIPPTDESTASLHLGDDSSSILVDAGGNVPRLMQDNELDYRELTEVLFTHSHPDHTYGFQFLSHCFYQTKKRIICHGPEETRQKVEAALEAFELQNPDKYLEVDFQTITVEKISQVRAGEELTIHAVPTRHGRPGVGYVFETPGQKIFYTADTAPNGRLRKAGKKSDVLLIDCQATEAYKRYFTGTHCSAAQAGQIAEELEVGAVVPFHYNTTEFPVSWQDLCDEIRENYRGTIVKPHRGMAFTL